MSKHRAESDAGETLVEVILTIVLMGVVIAALFAGFTTATGASKTHRDHTTADVVLRGYAEAIKDGVRRNCIGGTGAPAVSYTPPANFTVAPAPASFVTCPPTFLATVATPLAITTLTVTWPNGSGTLQRTLQIGLRSP